MPSPLVLSDDELDAVMTIAAPIPPSRRSDFLEAVATILRQPNERGPGLANRIGRELQLRYMHAPPNMHATARSRR
jgi:hypothetical protein